MHDTNLSKVGLNRRGYVSQSACQFGHRAPTVINMGNSHLISVTMTRFKKRGPSFGTITVHFQLFQIYQVIPRSAEFHGESKSEV